MAAHRTDRWHTVSFVSEALRGNPLGDPHERPLYVWVPDEPHARRYPCVYVIQGMAGWRRLVQRRAVDGLIPGPDRGARARGRGRARRRVDVGRRLAVGRLARRSAATTPTSATRSSRTSTSSFPTLAEPRQRGIQGKSSGGYGAMITPLLRPDLFGGLADTRRRRAVRGRTRATSRRRRARCATLRRLVRRVLGGLPLRPAGALLAGRRAARQHVRDGARVLRDDGRRAAVRPRDRRARPRGLGSAGCARPGRARARAPSTGRRCATCGPSGSTRGVPTSTTSSSARPRFTARSSRPGSRTSACTSSCSPARHRGLTWRYPLSLAFLVERPLEQLVVGLGEAELAVERVHVRRVQQPPDVRERAVVDHLADELLAEAAAAVLRRGRRRRRGRRTRRRRVAARQKPIWRSPS